MHAFRAWSIRHKLIGLFMALACVTATAISVPMALYDIWSFRQSMVQDLGILGDVLARNSTAALTFHDAEGAREVLSALREEPSVTAACIYTADGRPFARYVRDARSDFRPPVPAAMTTRFEAGRIIQFRPIVLDNETVGTLYLESDLQRLHTRLRGYNITFVVTLVFTFGLALAISSHLQRPISRPLLSLVTTAKAVSGAGDYSIRAALPNRDEFGLLVSEFNGMLEQIEKRDQELREHREHLEEQVAARTTELSALNTRLRLQAAGLEAAANAIVIMNQDGTLAWANRAFLEQTGYSLMELAQQGPLPLSWGQHDRTFYQQVWQTIVSGSIWHGEVVGRRRDGSFFAEDMTITPVRSEHGEITHFVAIKQDITERKQSEEALRKAEEKYRTMFEGAVVGMYQSTPDGQLVSANHSLAEMLGYDSPAELITRFSNVGDHLHDDSGRRDEFRQTLAAHGTIRDFEYKARRRDGTETWLLESARAVRDAAANVLFHEGTVLDISQRKLLEDQLRQAQKMEAVGRLAGGVAHDFNNAIGVITGYGELLQLSLSPEDRLYKHAKEITKAGQRAASLTRQLLAFSRKQAIQPVVLDLNSVVTDTDKMLRRLIGEDIDLTVVRESKLRYINADRGQIEQILMNLAVNARDAMPRGGKLIIETANSELDEAQVREHPFVKPGCYVMLKVSDTGCGMDKDVQARIFEPFFTTKATGQGTGLGLSMVYGIVKQSEGFIFVESEVGRGTAFKIYLPQVEAAGETAGAAPTPPTLPQGTETVLVVEDETSLRGLTCGCLRSVGYTVLEAPDAKSAIEIAADHGGVIHLLLTDVVMPGISGRELAEQLLPARREMKLLYMSGYTHDLISQHGVLASGTALLQKPFSIETLLTKVRAVLDDRIAQAATTV